MDEKALVEIFVPAASKRFDVFIPYSVMLSEVLHMLADILSDLCDGYYNAGNDVVLCDAESGIIFNINMSIADLHIKNGSRLMLI